VNGRKEKKRKGREEKMVAAPMYNGCWIGKVESRFAFRVSRSVKGAWLTRGERATLWEVSKDHAKERDSESSSHRVIEAPSRWLIPTEILSFLLLVVVIGDLLVGDGLALAWLHLKNTGGL
jgi:hypothetical protein